MRLNRFIGNFDLSKKTPLNRGGFSSLNFKDDEFVAEEIPEHGDGRRQHGGKLRPKNRLHIPETADHIDEKIIQADIQNETDQTYHKKTGDFFFDIFS